jgi:hypothetical protein
MNQTCERDAPEVVAVLADGIPITARGTTAGNWLLTPADAAAPDSSECDR